jgi:hypothetical protein
MRRCLGTSVVLAALLAALPAAAEEQPRAFSCTFNQGTALTYERGQFTPSKVDALAFDIADINPEAQTAKLVTPRGAGPLRVVQALNAIHFIEVVTEGFLNLTTVYDRDDAKGLYPAVHSRHFGLFGQPLVAQYRGFCAPK